MAPSLVIYGGKNCHLCEVAKAAADRVLPRYGLVYRHINIREDAALSELYDQMIPVIAVPRSGTGAAVAADGIARDGVAADSIAAGGIASDVPDVDILLFGNIDDFKLEEALVAHGFTPIDGESA